ncbi:MAG TPA: hypothetical protein VKV80_20780 [Streptosporangiaceae bacterium]|nr:hypothetical protein [Streptosporangiaceae bacterium]
MRSLPARGLDTEFAVPFGPAEAAADVDKPPGGDVLRGVALDEPVEERPVPVPERPNFLQFFPQRGHFGARVVVVRHAIPSPCVMRDDLSMRDMADPDRCRRSGC